jgi:hypothetical protein
VRYSLLIAILICITSAPPATAECWEFPIEVVATPGVAVISPAGTAPSLESRGLTIFVQLLDCNGLPIEGFPSQDIWVGDPGIGEVWMCQNGSVADSNTDPEGRTTISGAIFGGGYSTGGIQVYVSGVPVGPPEPLPLNFISADYDGNLVVDIIDFGEFAADFGQIGITRSDFAMDGKIDLSDFGQFAEYFGDSCP